MYFYLLLIFTRCAFSKCASLSQAECTTSTSCLWKLSSCQEALDSPVHILSSIRSKSQPEYESESESEVEADGRSPAPPCVGLDEHSCLSFPAICTWASTYCVPRSSSVQTSPGQEFEFESETEVEDGNQHTFDYTHYSSNPGYGTGPGYTPPNLGPTVPVSVQPQPVVVPPINSQVPALPSLPQTNIPVFTTTQATKNCASITNPMKCMLEQSCDWDYSSQGCILESSEPTNSKAPVSETSKGCLSLKTLTDCINADDAWDCVWDIPTQNCASMRQFQLAKTRTCVAETKEECHLFFGCQWEITRQLCILHNDALSGDIDPYSGTTEDLGTVDTQTPPFTATTTKKPSATKKITTGAPSLQSSMNCLMKTEFLCLKDHECFWDERQICLPREVQREMQTPTLDPYIQTTEALLNPPKSHSPRPHSAGGTALDVDAEASQESETENESETEIPATIFVNPLIQIVEEPPETETETETEHESPAAPSSSVETEAEHESESEYESGLTAITGEGGIDPFVPNYLPTDCEEFLYEPSCTKDKRCIWKSGECEWANFDCEDMDTKQLCVGAKYNGVPCIWSDHEQECDEAPIMLSQTHDEADSGVSTKTTTKDYFQYLWIFMLVVPGVLLGFVLGAYCGRSKSEKDFKMDSLLLDEISGSRQV